MRIPFSANTLFILAVLCFTAPSWAKLYKGYSNRFVVASEEIKAGDPFNAAVVYVVEHGFKGAGGLALNRRLTPEQLDQLPHYIKDRKLNLFWGGPVMFPDQISVLVRDPDTSKVKYEDLDDLISKTPDYLDQIERQADASAPNAFPRFYAGASVWGPLQLEREVWGGLWSRGKSNWRIIAEEPEGLYWEIFRKRFKDKSGSANRKEM